MGLGDALYHYDPGSRLGNNLLGYLPGHHRVISRYGTTIQPKVLDTTSMRRGEATRFARSVRMAFHQIVSEECITRIQA